MLVISRKQQEFVQIGENIFIKIIKTSRGSVKIGIAAPDECRVLRGELNQDALTAVDSEAEVEEESFTIPSRMQRMLYSNADAMKPVSALA